MKGMRRIFASFLIFISFTVSVWAQSSDDGKPKSVYDLPLPIAMQSRRYEMPNSILASVGYMPVDAFNRGFPIAAAYRHKLTDYLTWEALSFSYNVNQDTTLKSDLKGLKGALAARGQSLNDVGIGGKMDYPAMIAMTGLLFSPIYSKNLFFNSIQVYNETGIYFGAGMINFNEIGALPTIVPGLSSRFYLSRNSAVNGYFRDYFFVDDRRGVTGFIDFGFAYEYRFGGDSSDSTDVESSL